MTDRPMRTITLHVQDPNTGKQEDFEMDFSLAWSLHAAMTHLGAKYTEELIESAAGPREQRSVEDQRRVFAMIHMAHELFKRWPKPEDLLLRLCYISLSKGSMTRAQSAAFASEHLKEAIEPETWRKRVNKFAKEQGLPALNLPRGRRTPKPEK